METRPDMHRRHIHEGAGAVILPGGRVAVNAALALKGRPIIVDLKDVPVD